MPKGLKPFVLEIVLMLDFIQNEKKNLTLSYSIQMKEEIVGAYGSYGGEEICVEALIRKP
jgi:hypothetical protein